MIAYLIPNEAPDPRDGIGFIVWAPTEEQAIAKLKEQFRGGYEDMEAKFEYHTDNPKERPHFVVHWNADNTEGSELYWLHLADD
jgi:hypothetical protein